MINADVLPQFDEAIAGNDICFAALSYGGDSLGYLSLSSCYGGVVVTNNFEQVRANVYLLNHWFNSHDLGITYPSSRNV